MVHVGRRVLWFELRSWRGHLTSDHEPIDLIFAALGHPIRRKIVEHLASSGASSITDLAAPFDVSIMAISKHVKVLREAMVVTVERRGRTHWCTVNFEALRFAREWLDHHERVSREVELFELAAESAGKTRDWAGA